MLRLSALLVCASLLPLHTAQPASPWSAAGPYFSVFAQGQDAPKHKAKSGAGQDQGQNQDQDQDDDDDSGKEKKHDQPVPASKIHNPVLWQDPGQIAGKDLFYGQGGTKHQPKPPFTFLAESTSGTNPKFDVRDADGHKWRVKLGEEPRPEVVASRLLWAVGYFANDDYLLPTATIDGIHLNRGQNRVGKGNVIQDARFQRRPKGQKKIGIWRWTDNPFLQTPEGTRQLDGLRVMMAVINNWDLKDVNNAVYSTKDGRQIFLCSDVGASFGTNGLSFSRSRSKGNLGSFKGSKFITRQDADTVDFATPAAPNAYILQTFGFGAVSYAERLKLDGLGKNIPIADARWMGSLLGQLTHKQLTDAFRAGNFSPEEVEAYVTIVEARISELKAL